MRDGYLTHQRNSAEARKARLILWCAALAAVVSLGAGMFAGPY
jgi:hypothetical protein